MPKANLRSMQEKAVLVIIMRVEVRPMQTRQLTEVPEAIINNIEVVHSIIMQQEAKDQEEEEVDQEEQLLIRAQ